jgi:DNA-binding LacI/PurR family transcriptional regulator/DNA-binding CsgD family transcriptional regulator/PAS domain-containing protein
MQLKSLSKRKCIGVIFDLFEHPFHNTISRKLVSIAREMDINLVFFSGYQFNVPYTNDEQFNMIYNLINTNYLDGLIISAASLACYDKVDQKDIEGFLAQFSAIPLVSIGLTISTYPSIVIDNKNGMKESILHLIEKHNRTKIGFITGPEQHQEADARFAGYREVLKEKNLDYDPSRVFRGNFEKIIDTDLLVQAAKNGMIDSIAAANDDMAIKAIALLKRSGIKVPEDMSVTGFDDLLGSIFFEPPLTTVRNPAEQIASEAFKAINQMIDQQAPSGARELKTAFIVRHSCGCEYNDDHRDPVMNQNILSDYYIKIDNWRRNWNALLNGMETSPTNDSLIAELPAYLINMGIDQFYLCLYQSTVHISQTHTPRYSNLVFAMENGKIIVNNSNSIEFITKRLLPNEIMKDEGQYVHAVQPLIILGVNYGYIIIGINRINNLAYEIIRQQIGNALYIINLNRKNKEADNELSSNRGSLKLKEEHLNDTLYNLPSILIDFNHEFQVTYINKAAEEIFADPSGKIPDNLKITGFIHKDDRSRFEDYCLKVPESRETRMIEIRFINNKITFELLCFAVSTREENNQTGFRLNAVNLNSLLRLDNVLDEELIKSFHLSVREKEVLKYLMIGGTYKSIGEKLSIAPSTVKDHIQSIYGKMGVENKKEFYYQYRNFLNKSTEHESLIFMFLKLFLNE